MNRLNLLKYIASDVKKCIELRNNINQRLELNDDNKKLNYILGVYKNVKFDEQCITFNPNVFLHYVKIPNKEIYYINGLLNEELVCYMTIMYYSGSEVENKNAEELGFIILRHVNDKLTSQYWKVSYDHIRLHYPENKILIIDDNSKYEYINNENGLYKTTIIKSEFPKRGELLPYYYFIKTYFANNACIIHDSVFVNKKIDLSVDKYKFLWSFANNIDSSPRTEISKLKVFNDEHLIECYKSKKWDGCFGGMSIISYDYVYSINMIHPIHKLIPVINCREDRKRFERIIAVLLTYHSESESSLSNFGSIHKYQKWDLKFSKRNRVKHLPFIKVWTGR